MYFLAIFGSNETASKTSLVNIMMQLRKAIGHPYLFPGIEPEPFEMGEHLSKCEGKIFSRLTGCLQLKQVANFIFSIIFWHIYTRKKHKVLLFSQFTTVLDILQDYLTYREIYKYERKDLLANNLHTMIVENIL